MGLFSSDKVQWKKDNILLVNGVRFYLARNFVELQTVQSSNKQFLLGKPRWLVEKYLKLLSSTPTKNIFELGILKGGSVALYHAYCKPSKLVAVELSTKPVAALEDYIVKKECRDTIKPYYGINQADRKVLSILEDEFPGRDIDLVVDDASHLYHESKESFNMIFPYLRPGGLYIIEDWAWSHTSLWQGENAKWSDKPALTNLIFEIIMACPSTTDMIEEIVIDKNNALIYKGDSAIQSNEFDISKSYINRGKEFVPFL